jgi:hypothetical protein
MCQHGHRGHATVRAPLFLRTASTIGSASVLGLFPPRQGAKAAAQVARGTVNLAHSALTTDLRITVNTLWHSLDSPWTQGIVKSEQRRDRRKIRGRGCAMRRRRWRCSCC